jgi:hypothetical protein
VIDGDYIRQSMRDRTQELVTQELWPCNDQAAAQARKASASPPNVATIIKRIHRSLTAHGLDRGPAGVLLSAEQIDTSVIGRLLERGLHDELYGSAYAIVDGIDGRLIIFASLLLKPPASRSRFDS